MLLDTNRDRGIDDIVIIIAINTLIAKLKYLLSNDMFVTRMKKEKYASIRL
jgi:hypothetical protein